MGRGSIELYETSFLSETAGQKAVQTEGSYKPRFLKAPVPRALEPECRILCLCGLWGPCSFSSL